MTEPVSGRKLGRYLLEEKLGSGATADVFRAIQSGVERPVAIKVMHPHLAASADFSARFVREAQALGRLQHPHVGRVIDFEPDEQHPYMVLEYLAGGSLRDVMDANPPRLPIDYGVSVARQVADGLAYAHSLGMVHRDLKPANVMFVDREARHAVLTDFGMARLTDEKLTMSGTMLGTPAYMAPEQVLGQNAGPAADQYSLGVMLFELVTGELPFTADNIHALMIKHTTEPVPSVRSRNPQVSHELESIIVRAMAKDPAQRFADAAALRDALDRVGTGVSESMRSATIVAPVTSLAAPPTVSKSSPSRVKLGVAAIGVVAVAGVAAFGLTRGGGDTDVVAGAETTVEADAAGVPEGQPLPPAAAGAPDPSASAEQTPTAATAVAADPAASAEIPALSIASSEIRGDRLLLSFDRARRPAAGAQYVVWLDQVAGPVGVLVFDDTGRAGIDAGVDNLRQARTLLISEEPIEGGVDLTQPSGPVLFTRSVDEATAAVLEAIGAELIDARTEMDVAREHDQFLRDEINAGNIAEVRRHGEHVVNILDGGDGENFGDHDGDGVAQNPGNGVGVRAYAETIAARAEGAALFGSSIADRARQLADQAVAAETPYLRFASAASPGEVDPSVATDLLDQADQTLTDLERGLDRELALQLTRDPLVPIDQDLGTVWLVNGGTEVLVQRGPALHRPGQDALELVIGDPSAAGLRSELDDFGIGRASVRVADLTSLGSIGLAVPGTTGLAAVATLPVASLEALGRLIGGPSSLVPLLSAEAQIAIEHALFMQADIDAGDHASARRHAEHTVNIVEGNEGEHFGDLDGDGQAQNPGSGVGILRYLDDIEALLETMPADTTQQQFARRRWLDALDQIRINALASVEAALRVVATDTADEADPIVDDVYRAMALVVDGDDVDGNGVVDPVAGEMGVRDLGTEAASLVTAPLQIAR